MLTMRKVGKFCILTGVLYLGVPAVGSFTNIQAQEKKQFDERSVSFAEERYPIAVGCAALLYAVNALI